MSDEEHIKRLEAGLEEVRLATARQVQLMADMAATFDAQSQDEQAPQPATRGMYFDLAAWLAESLSSIAQNNLALTDMSVSLAKIVTNRTRRNPPEIVEGDEWKFGIIRPNDDDEDEQD